MLSLGVANIAFGIHESNHYSSHENTSQTERNAVSFFGWGAQQETNSELLTHLCMFHKRSFFIMQENMALSRFINDGYYHFGCHNECIVLGYRSSLG